MPYLTTIYLSEPHHAQTAKPCPIEPGPTIRYQNQPYLTDPKNAAPRLPNHARTDPTVPNRALAARPKPTPPRLTARTQHRPTRRHLTVPRLGCVATPSRTSPGPNLPNVTAPRLPNRPSPAKPSATPPGHTVTAKTYLTKPSVARTTKPCHTVHVVPDHDCHALTDQTQTRLAPPNPVPPGENFIEQPPS